MTDVGEVSVKKASIYIHVSRMYRKQQLCFMSSKKSITIYRLSFTKKCSQTKLATVNATKKMPSSDIFGHQKDYTLSISPCNP